MDKNFLIWLLSGLALLIIIAFSVQYYYSKTSIQPYSSTNTIFDSLMKNNASAKEAHDLRLLGDYDKALVAYEAAMSSATDNSQKGYIEMSIATTLAMSGDRIGAIKKYKQIVANLSYNPAARAYAILYMGQMHYNSLDDTSITAEIFKDEPYKSFFVEGNTALSYRHLFEYSSSFYPLALSELRIADWYASRITELYKVSESSPEIMNYRAIIDVKISNADAEFKRMASYPNETPFVRTALTRKAVILEKLSYLDFASAANAEAAFKVVLDLYSTTNLKGREAILRYYYARFLLKTYGEKRAMDITEILKPIYTKSEYKTPATELFFKYAPKENSLRTERLKSLALLDQNFRLFLMSLGWKVTDFNK